MDRVSATNVLNGALNSVKKVVLKKTIYSKRWKWAQIISSIVLFLVVGAAGLIGNSVPQKLAEEVGLKYGAAMAAAMGPTVTSSPDGSATGAVHRSFRSALHAVADALTAHGFAAHAERHGDGLRIVSDHCPFGGAAIEHPVICAVDRGLVRGMLGALYGEADAATSSSLPMGDARCVTDLTHAEVALPGRAMR